MDRLSDADVFEETISEPVAHGDDGRCCRVECFRNGLPGRLGDERSRADRVDDDRYPQLVSQEDLPQVCFRFPVVQDSAPAEDQEIQFLDLRGDLFPG